MTLNLSCHLEMLTLERAISIGTCGLIGHVRIVGQGGERGNGLSKLTGLPGNTMLDVQTTLQR